MLSFELIVNELSMTSDTSEKDLKLKGWIQNTLSYR